MRDAPGFEVELKGLDSADLPALDQEPADPAKCRIEITVRVGPSADSSGDDFTLFFVTPAWLAGNIGAQGFRVLNYTVIVERFEWSIVERAARELVASVYATSWEEFVDRFSRIAYWEYSHESPPTRYHCE